MLQSLGRPELHMALEVTIVSGSGQEHAGCLLLTSEVLFVVSLSEDTQQQAFPITEVTDNNQGRENSVVSHTSVNKLKISSSNRPVVLCRWSVCRSQDSRTSSH